MALEILEEIEENIGVCCAVTMEPDEVLLLIDKLNFSEMLERILFVSVSFFPLRSWEYEIII